MSLEPYSLKGYEPIDSIEQDAPLGHGVQQNFGADTRKTGQGNKSSFWKGKNGRQYARRPNGRIITHDAEALGGDDASLADFNGVESVVVQAPLGHGVTQYFAEGDEPEPQFNDGVTGQDGPNADPTNAHFSAEGCPNCGFAAEGDEPEPHFNDGVTGQDGPNADPTNANFSAQGYDDRMDESMGMRNRGPHSQSMKDRRDEASAMDKGHSMMGRKYDDVATMDAEHEGVYACSKCNHWNRNPVDGITKCKKCGNGNFTFVKKSEHNHWHNKSDGQFYGKWSKHKKNGQFSTHNAESYSELMGPTIEANEGGLHSPSSFDISWEDGSGLSSASIPPNEIHFADTHDADFTLEKPVKTGFMVAFGAGLFSLAAVAGTVIVGNLLGGNKQ